MSLIFVKSVLTKKGVYCINSIKPPPRISPRVLKFDQKSQIFNTYLLYPTPYYRLKMLLIVEGLVVCN